MSADSASHERPGNDELLPASDTEPSPGEADTTSDQQHTMPKELGGPKGPEPTRYGDWERKGRCSDF